MKVGDGNHNEEGRTVAKKFKSSNPAKSLNWGSMTSSHTDSGLINVTARKVERGIVVSWQPHDVSNGDLIRVQAFRDGKEFGRFRKASESKYVLRAADADKTYYFHVWIHSASGHDGPRAWSNEVRMLAALMGAVSSFEQAKWWTRS